MSTTGRSFPQDFLFGAATAAYQIEGAAHEDGRRDSIWDVFCRVPGAVVGGDNGDVACDHYHRYRDDVALMKRLGLQTYRFSVSWSRVRPDGGALNPAGLDFYKRLVDELREADILPWLTLYHWDLPQALQERGGWTARSTADLFTEYALDMHDALGDRVPVWTTLNEPWCASFLSYTGGEHAPGHHSIEEGLLASHHLLLGHGQAVRELRARDASLDLGITLNHTVADPADPQKPADVDAARRVDGQFNRWFLDPIHRASYPADIVEDIRKVDAAAVASFEAAVRDGDLATIAQPIDTQGVNYYHGDLVSGTAPEHAPVSGGPATTRAGRSPYPSDAGIHPVERGLPRTAQGWEVQPEGLTRLLQRVHDEYTGEKGVRLFVTENGAAYDDVVTEGAVHDPDRVTYVRAHLGAVLDAVDAGVDVRGYFYWSLLDNFEWAWGYDKRFGIVRVDYETQERTPKDSALEYARIIAERALDDVSTAGAR
ncbi:GH1 family beta-glucosidase [Microbacterium horticulturae]|uniref:Beta-glucosidase n=1 Tax=Microbacterium horticulturae TaxID=3028316 RepID=A0ABY8BYW6_9MICO|nr:GH1 family beta-glucosidase [Microbacterium sp. KACC 23027]WEG09072.1 GH1 family beta-glucosidase [Microbacterium sp. KACC 23027]